MIYTRIEDILICIVMFFWFLGLFDALQWLRGV